MPTKKDQYPVTGKRSKYKQTKKRKKTLHYICKFTNSIALNSWPYCINVRCIGSKNTITACLHVIKKTLQQ